MHESYLQSQKMEQKVGERFRNETNTWRNMPRVLVIAKEQAILLALTDEGLSKLCTVSSLDGHLLVRCEEKLTRACSNSAAGKHPEITTSRAPKSRHTKSSIDSSAPLCPLNAQDSDFTPKVEGGNSEGLES